MARIEISFFTTGNRSAEGGTMPVPRASNLRTEVLASGSVSAATTSASGDAAGTGFVRISADGDVWVTVGAAPVAVVPAAGQALAGLRAKAGAPLDLAVGQGDRVAVIDA